MDHTELVHQGRPHLADDQRAFAVDPNWFTEAGLTPEQLQDPVAIARVMKPSILVGTTGCRGAFTEALIREVASHVERPLILPLSNPGDRAEAQPDELAVWTEGRAIVATGSPCPPVEFGGTCRIVGQANNVFIFPGVGLAAIVAEAREVTDDAFGVAARELAGLVSAERLASGAIYPPISELRHVARAIAVTVVRHLRDTGYGRQFRDEEIEPAVERAIWWPDYLPVVAGATDAVSSSRSGIR